jgi:hypothetical protein
VRGARREGGVRAVEVVMCGKAVCVAWGVGGGVFYGGAGEAGGGVGAVEALGV